MMKCETCDRDADQYRVTDDSGGKPRQLCNRCYINVLWELIEAYKKKQATAAKRIEELERENAGLHDGLNNFQYDIRYIWDKTINSYVYTKMCHICFNYAKGFETEVEHKSYCWLHKLLEGAKPEGKGE